MLQADWDLPTCQVIFYGSWQYNTTLHYPDFTDTANPESWRSWLVLQNPSASPANLTYEIRSRAGDILYTGSDTIPAYAVNAIRPRNLAGADCAGSAIVTSDQPIIGTCQITRNSNEMCMSYNALDQGSETLSILISRILLILTAGGLGWCCRIPLPVQPI